MTQARSSTRTRTETMAQATQTTDIFKLLKHDHDELKGMFESIVSDHKRNEDDFAKLKSELIAHSKAEEKTFYQAIMDMGEEIKEMVLDGTVEHHVAETLAKEIGKEADDEKWLAKVRVLEETVLHHLKEEEGQMFKAAKPKVDRTMARELGEKFQRTKK